MMASVITRAARKESGREKLTGGTWSLERREGARELGTEQAFARA